MSRVAKSFGWAFLLWKHPKGTECVSVGKKLVEVLQICLAVDPIPGNCREPRQPGRLLCEVFARDVTAVPSDR
jgi:hypothetical protein